MAEVVGVVAAAVAFAEVMVKIGTEVFALKSKWEDVKEIPETIRQLADDIELLGFMLQEMESDLNSPSPDGAVWGGTTIGAVIVTTCRGALDVLIKSIDELSQEISSVRRSRRVMIIGKMVLKKDFWASHEKRLQRVIWMLSLAQQQWTMSVPPSETCAKILVANLRSSLTKRQPDLIVSRLQLSQSAETSGRVEELTDTDTVDEPHETVQNQHFARRDGCFNHYQRLSLSKRNLTSSLFGTIGVYLASPRASRTGQNMSKDYSSVYTVHAQAPNWLTQKAWNMTISISYSGFDMSLRMYSVVPKDSQVMRFAKHGDIEGLLKLFNRKLASPFDITEDGDRLIDMAIGSGNIQALGIMMDWGLDLYQCFDRAHSARALKTFTTTLYGTHSSSSTREKLSAIHELALAKNVYDDLASLTDSWLLSDRELNEMNDIHQSTLKLAAIHISVNPRILQLFLLHLRPGHYDLPVTERLFFSSACGLPNPDSLRYMLWRDGKVQADDIQALDQAGIPLLKLAAKHYRGRCCIKSKIDSRPTPGWRQLARDITRYTTPLHSCRETTEIRKLCIGSDGFHGTALHTVIAAKYYGYCRCRRVDKCAAPSMSEWRRADETALRYWLEDLKSNGIDLNEYGKIEEKIFSENKWFSSMQEGFLEPAQVLPRLTLFTYGSEPEDWKFSWEIDYQEVVAEFWEQIENSLPNIVGAWVD